MATTPSSRASADAAVFVRVGIAGASVEEICVEAGLTRGELYSNFANKDELVLAMIDDYVDCNLAGLHRLVERADTTIEYLESLESTERRREGPLGSQPVLHTEFMLYALRNPANRSRLAKHQRRWREVIAEVVRQDFAQFGGTPPMSVEDAAELILALDDGYLLHELIEPGSYRAGHVQSEPAGTTAPVAGVSIADAGARTRDPAGAGAQPGPGRGCELTDGSGRRGRRGCGVAMRPSPIRELRLAPADLFDLVVGLVDPLLDLGVQLRLVGRRRKGLLQQGDATVHEVDVSSLLRLERWEVGTHEGCACSGRGAGIRAAGTGACGERHRTTTEDDGPGGCCSGELLGDLHGGASFCESRAVC
jgi:AcrR family transcriptional regulator